MRRGKAMTPNLMPSIERDPRRDIPCPGPGCQHPNGGPVAKDGVYQGLRFCLCHQFDTGPYTRVIREAAE